MSEPELFEYVGAIHIHTTDSDGTKSHAEIIKIAAELQLDYLMFSDHNTLKGLSHEGFHDGVAVVVGYEINDPDNKNHYLAFGLDRTLPPGLSARDYVREVRRRRGLGIIAHPDEVRTSTKYPSYPWTEWGVRDFDGIEIWNHMSAWMEQVTIRNITKMLISPRSFLKTPSKNILARWDEMAQHRRVAGIGALDVHAIPYRLGPFRITIFPYKVQLQAIRTHILLKRNLPSDFKEAKRALLNALRKAHIFFCNYRWGSGRGFRFWAESPEGVAVIGDAISEHPRLTFAVRLPDAAHIVLVHNGNKVLETDGKEAHFRWTKPGAVRVEVYKGDKGWIFSNHIKVKKAHSGEHKKKPRRRENRNREPHKESR